MRTTATCLGATLVVLFSLLAVPCFAVVPAHFWSINAGGDQGATVACIAIVPSNGDVVATGYFFGTMDLGTGPMVGDNTFGETADIWIARFSRAGQVKWAKHFGGSSLDAGAAVVLDASGNICLLANIGGSMNFGGGTVNGNIALVKFDGNGNHIWSYGYYAGTSATPTRMAIDASGNLIICGAYAGTGNFGGADAIANGPDGFIVKYNSAGTFQWQQIVTGNGQQVSYGLATDAASNIYSIGYFGTEVTFQGFSPMAATGGIDVYIAKLNSAGTYQWTQKRGGTGDDIGIAIAADASGNVTVSGGFHDTVNFGGSSLISAGGFDGFLARYNTSGIHQWSLRWGTAAEIETGYYLAVNSSNKVFLAGASEADLNGTPGFGQPDVLVAKFSSTGALTWSRLVGGSGDDRGFALGLDVGDNVVVGGNFQGAADFGGGNRVSHGQGDLFLARYGVAEPAITTVKDVGNDQGRNVRITLARSPLDDGSAALPITEYQAWRRILPLPSVSSLRNGGPQQALPSGTWEYVSSTPASNLSTYRMIAPTLADSTIAFGMYRTKFFVRAATANPSVFYDSPVDSGYSLDNLAPGIPTNFVLNTGNLSWDKSNAADFDYFTVYGSSANSFGTATLIDYTVSPAMDVTSSGYNYYWVTATDFSGNEGKPAQAHSTTGVGEGSLPRVLSISAYPNPFNPETTVRYTLPSRSHVKIDIFGLNGEHVATLVDRDHDAGAFTATWRGLNDAGSSVSSGVYFAKLSAGGKERTYKLTLLK
jgi:FlgD Ig-like domain